MNNVISLDLVGFLFDEIKDHVEKLYEISITEDPDIEKAEYHHEKFLTMINKLKESYLGGA